MARLQVVPNFLEIEVTDMCNARCIMCAPEVHLGNTFMDPSQYRRIVAEGYAIGIRKMNITGGEPLLDKSIFEKIRYAKDIGYQYIHLFTNGSALNERNRGRLLDSGLDSLTVSVDSAVESEYEKIRIGLRFRQVRDNLQSLYAMKITRRQSNPLIRVNMVALKENARSRARFKEVFSGCADVVEIIDSHNYAGTVEEDESSREYSQKRRLPCHLLFNKAVVSPKGHLKKCSIDYSKEGYVSNLRSTSLSDALKGDKLIDIKTKMAKRQFDISGCDVCTYKGFWWSDG